MADVVDRPQLELVDDRQVSCLLCGEDGRVLLRRPFPTGTPSLGLCEACSVHAYWAWKQFLADAAPGASAAPEVARTLVLVTRLARVGEDLADPSVPESYEVALVAGESEAFELPSTYGDDEHSVGRALLQAGIVSWRSCTETLFVGYTARGRLVRVVTVTAWTDAKNLTDDPRSSDASVVWRPWSEWEAGWGGMAGFYAALRTVWRLRIWKHAAEGKKTTAPTVRLRRVATEYLNLLRLQGRPNADTSMLPVLRQQLSVDEKIMVRAIGGAEARQSQVAAETVKTEEASEPVTDVEYEDSGDGGDGVDNDPLAGEGADD